MKADEFGWSRAFLHRDTLRPAPLEHHPPTSESHTPHLHPENVICREILHLLLTVLHQLGLQGEQNPASVGHTFPLGGEVGSLRVVGGRGGEGKGPDLSLRLLISQALKRSLSHPHPSASKEMVPIEFQ